MNDCVITGRAVQHSSGGKTMIEGKTGVALAGTLAVTGIISLGGVAQAQSLPSNPPVEIRNTGDETRKICFHKPKRVTLLAIGCVTLKKGENIYWDRKGVFTPFKVKIYEKRKLIDKYLYARDLPADTGKVIVGNGARFGYSRFKNISKQFTVRVCNNTQNDPVYFALGLDYADKMVSEGWWNVKKGECKNIPISKRAKDNWNLPYSQVPRVFYYARTYGDKPLYWNKGDGARVFCLNPGKRFKGYLGGNRACAQDAEEQTYRLLTALSQRSDEIQYLTF